MKSMRYVILPQAFRIALPPFINHTIVLFKNTSLAMAVGIAEMTYVVRESELKNLSTCSPGRSYGAVEMGPIGEAIGVAG
jgi:ABC-type amino acid transport system permease subunit